jgi:predicted DCC family thiol-disulfide oxidoreductase YuxK
MDRPVLLYDHDCGFCRWSLARVLKRDRDAVLAVAPIESPTGDRLLAHMDREARLASWHLALPGGRVHSGGAAFAPLASAIGRWSAVGRLAERFPRAAAAAYRLVAGNRSRLSRFVPASAKARADRAITARRALRGSPESP